MIDFIDLNNGKTYNGFYDTTSDAGYIHWLPESQSTYIYYSHKICFICDSDKVTCSMQENEVFKLVDPKYDQLNLTDIIVPISNNKQTLQLQPYILGPSQYIYTIYFVAKSEQAGEVLEDIVLKYNNNTKYIRVGGDFYGEDERIYINLANFGLEIPQQIQSTFYNTDPNENYFDNILLNRKFKELLSNYWDIIANKGSYKSLINSLKWFEWGDKLQLKELWSHIDVDKVKRYDIRDLKSIMDDKYKDTFNNTIKSTYIAILCSLAEVQDDLKVQSIAFDNSLEELSLKLSLLGNFFETYFTPIHIDLIHSLVTIPVVNKTPASIKSGIIPYSLEDYKYKTFECNVKDGDSFNIDLVNCYVDNDTLFKNQSSNEYGIIPIGVSKSVSIDAIDKNDNEELKLFYSQWRNERGCIVSFNPIFDKELTLYGNSVVIINNTETTIGRDVSSKELYFNLFFKEEGSYKLEFKFNTNDGIYHKIININILPIQEPSLDIYLISSYGSEDLPKDFYFKSAGNSYTTTDSQTQYANSLGTKINLFDRINKSIVDNEYLYIKPSHPFNENMEDIQWILKNKCGKSVELKGARSSIVTAPTWKGQLENGYYDVIMRYKMNNKYKEIRCNNAFKKV